MTEPEVDFDLDALVVEDEDAPPFTFKWGGKRYELPLMKQLPFHKQLLLETVTDLEAVSILVGEELARELAETKGADGRTLSIGRFGELFNAWFKHQGLEPGESLASQRSSGNTARPSKRTSRSGRGRRTN
jgi:hypothetical protein